ncbi:MAG: adenylyl-sulfate kinase [Candidatus Hydrogenedentes bacterium]|nr:adenylyl-sulfate kinase [Candidatus Hydrogenedentota bacterium]
MAETIKSTNITWHHADITKDDRERLNGHKAVVLWFTGLSGSGKSTLAHAVENALFERGCRTYVLAGDNIRHGLNKNAGEIKEFTGISAPYEEPLNAEVVVDTGKLSLEQCTEAVLKALSERGVISA